LVSADRVEAASVGATGVAAPTSFSTVNEAGDALEAAASPAAAEDWKL
jgi:hypothetical protein